MIKPKTEGKMDNEKMRPVSMNWEEEAAWYKRRFEEVRKLVVDQYAAPPVPAHESAEWLRRELDEWIARAGRAERLVEEWRPVMRACYLPDEWPDVSLAARAAIDATEEPTVSHPSLNAAVLRGAPLPEPSSPAPAETPHVDPVSPSVLADDGTGEARHLSGSSPAPGPHAEVTRLRSWIVQFATLETDVVKKLRVLAPQALAGRPCVLPTAEVSEYERRHNCASAAGPTPARHQEQKGKPSDDETA